MVALLRHFLAGSLLLLAVFTPNVDAKAKCTQGGICFGQKTVNPNDHPYDKTFKPIECDDKCYQFYCFANGGINAGVGCKESVEKNCPDQADKILKGDFVKNQLEGDGFFVRQCTDNDCEMSSLDVFGTQYDKARVNHLPLWGKITAETCNYNSAIGYGTSMVLLGSLVAGWILALRLW